MEKIVSLKNVSKTFPVGKSLLGKPTKFVHAVNNVSFDVFEGETFSIVGESGCGKSTTGRLINHLLTPDSGEIWFMGKEISRISQDAMRPLRKDMQMIFQDPAGSLDPRMRVAELIEEPLLIHTDMSAGERMKVVNELLGIVGLSAKHAKRYPHEFSGGQKQRIGIARALTVNPKLVIADEPISALDVSIQAQVLNLLHRLQEEYKLTYVFISHDLSVVEMISDRIAVMYLGFVVEMVICGQLGVFAGMTQAQLTELYVLALLLAALAYWKHKENIVRLIHGNERKTYLTKKNKVDVETDGQEKSDGK